MKELVTLTPTGCIGNRGINEAALGACMPPVTLNLVRARLSPHSHDRIAG